MMHKRKIRTCHLEKIIGKLSHYLEENTKAKEPVKVLVEADNV